MFVKESLIKASKTGEYVILGNLERLNASGSPAAMLDQASPLVMRLVNAGKSEQKMVRDWQLAVSDAHIDCHGMEDLWLSAPEVVRFALAKSVARRLGESNFYVAAVRVNELGVPNLLIGKQDMPGAYADVIFGKLRSELHLRFETLRPIGDIWAQDMHIYDRTGMDRCGDYAGVRVRQWLKRRKDRQRSDCWDLAVTELRTTGSGGMIPARYYENVPVTPIISPSSPEFDRD